MSEMKEVKIVYFGMTGQGKSLNGCFVLNKQNIFKVGNFAEGETNFCSIGENIISIDDKKYKVSILDTLGLGAEVTKGGLSEEDCIKKIKEGLEQHKDVKCIALVHNCTNVRMTNDENKMLNIYIRMLPPQEIWKNICIIYTNFDCSKDDEEKKEIIDNLNNPREGFTICFINKLKQAIETRNKELPENQRIDLSKMDGYKIQTFFMDSKTKNLERNKKSVEESHRLIKWACELQYLDLHAVSLIITKREPEEKEFLLSSRDEDVYVIKTFIRKTREKKTNKLGKISYSEWKEIPSSKREIKEMLEFHEDKREHHLLKKYEEDKYLVECYQSQKRKVYHMSNGEYKPLEWEFFGDIDTKKFKLPFYYKPREEKLKDIKYLGKKEIKFYQKRHKKVYIHKLNDEDYESSQSSDDGDVYSKEIELSPTESYYEYENRRIIKYDSYRKTLKGEKKGLTTAGAALTLIPVFGWIAGAAMMGAGAGEYKTIYKYKQEIYKRKVNKYSTGYIEKGEWEFSKYEYFENSDSEYDRKH